MARNPSITGIHPRKLSAREKAANHMVATERNIRTRKIGPKGTADRSIIFERPDGSRYHSTKGWRAA